MKLSILFCAFTATAVSAFSFSAQRGTMTMSASTSDRRGAIAKIAGFAAAGIPTIASADGAISAASIQKARSVYGDRIFALKKSVEAGDFSAVVEEKSAFILFNSGAYPKDSKKRNAAIAGTNAIFAAVRTKDSAALKSAFDSYIASNKITGLPAVSSEGGQGYSSDFDYRRLSKAGAIYVR